MDILNKKQKIILAIILIFISCFIGYYIIKKISNLGYIELETENIIETNDKNFNNYEKKEDEEVVIHITGEVKKQGIVKVKQGARISDVIEEAGGTTKNADLSKINLAYIVQDGQKIYVPNFENKKEIETITQEAGINVVENNNKENKVNINKASQTELETLNGIGTATALKIINYRNENGEFKKIEDIKNVPGIGEAKFENIKNDICT